MTKFAAKILYFFIILIRDIFYLISDTVCCEKDTNSPQSRGIAIIEKFIRFFLYRLFLPPSAMVDSMTQEL